jgi:hypothetical protein
MVFRGKCPFRVFIKSKPRKYGLKLWVAADAKNFYACSMQVYSGKSGVREKKQGVRVVKIWSVTCMEPEEVLLLIISLQAVNQ